MPTSTIGAGADPRIGYTRFGHTNPLAPGGVLPESQGSYLARVSRPSIGDGRLFGLGDHISVPLSHLEAGFTQALAQTVEGLFARIRTLKVSADALASGTDNGVFDRRKATTTSTAVSADARNRATLARYSVDVLELARAQQNVGAQMRSTDPSQVAVGLHTIQITVGGVAVNVNVNVGPGASNMDALTAVRDAINASGAAVDASIETTVDVSQLVLTAASTGTAAAFALTDVAGNVVAATSAATVAAKAADAVVQVNGVEQTLPENRLTADAPFGGGTGRLALYFHDRTRETVLVDVTVSYDADEVVTATRRLVEAVNDVRSFVEDKPQILSRGLLGRLSLAVDGLRASLDRVGIRSDEAGGLRVEEPGLRRALDERPSEVQQRIGGPDGLAARERSVAETVLGTSTLAFAARPGPIGSSYGRLLVDSSRYHNFVFGGLFLNLRI